MGYGVSSAVLYQEDFCVIKVQPTLQGKVPVIVAARDIDATGTVGRVIDGDTFDATLIGRVGPADIEAPRDRSLVPKRRVQSRTSSEGGEVIFGPGNVRMVTDAVVRTSPWPPMRGSLRGRI